MDAVITPTFNVLFHLFTFIINKSESKVGNDGRKMWRRMTEQIKVKNGRSRKKQVILSTLYCYET